MKFYQNSEPPVFSTAKILLKANRDAKLSTVVLWRETKLSAYLMTLASLALVHKKSLNTYFRGEDHMKIQRLGFISS